MSDETPWRDSYSDDDIAGQAQEIVKTVLARCRTLEADLLKAVEDRVKLREAMGKAIARLTDMSKLDFPLPWACEDTAKDLQRALADVTGK